MSNNEPNVFDASVQLELGSSPIVPRSSDDKEMPAVPRPSRREIVSDSSLYASSLPSLLGLDRDDVSYSSAPVSFAEGGTTTGGASPVRDDDENEAPETSIRSPSTGLNPVDARRFSSGSSGVVKSIGDGGVTPMGHYSPPPVHSTSKELGNKFSTYFGRRNQDVGIAGVVASTPAANASSQAGPSGTNRGVRISSGAGGSGGGGPGRGPGQPAGNGNGGNGAGGVQGNILNRFPSLQAAQAGHDVVDANGIFDVDVTQEVDQYYEIRADKIASEYEVNVVKANLFNYLTRTYNVQITRNEFIAAYQALVLILAVNGSSARAELKDVITLTVGGQPREVVGSALAKCIATTRRRFLRANADLAAELGFKRKMQFHWGKNIIGIPGNLGFDCADYTSNLWSTPSQREAIRRYSENLLQNTVTLENDVPNHVSKLGLGNTNRPFVPQTSAQAAAGYASPISMYGV